MDSARNPAPGRAVITGLVCLAASALSCTVFFDTDFPSAASGADGALDATSSSDTASGSDTSPVADTSTPIEDAEAPDASADRGDGPAEGDVVADTTLPDGDTGPSDTGSPPEDAPANDMVLDRGDTGAAETDAPVVDTDASPTDTGVDSAADVGDTTIADTLGDSGSDVDSAADGGGDTCPDNGCGGCVVLANPPGTDCGACGAYVCDGSNATMCEDPGINSCGGCELLPHEPEEVCGPCSLDQYLCNGDDEVECSGETFANDCDGCEPLDETPPGDPCCEMNSPAEWGCDGAGAVYCSDFNEHLVDATAIGDINDSDDTTVSYSGGAFVSEADRDWYEIAYDGDQAATAFKPTAYLQFAELPSDELSLALCVFFTYDDERGADLDPYSCVELDHCSVFDSSLESIVATGHTSAGCDTYPGFAPTGDLYGCCDSEPTTDSRIYWDTGLMEIDAGADTDLGTVFVLVEVAEFAEFTECTPYGLGVYATPDIVPLGSD